MADLTPRERLTDRLRCLIAAGPMDVDEAEHLAADLIEATGLPAHLFDEQQVCSCGASQHACNWCHDDPPRGHTCPRCGREAGHG
jgi:hypothetical protein